MILCGDLENNMKYLILGLVIIIAYAIVANLYIKIKMRKD